MFTWPGLLVGSHERLGLSVSSVPSLVIVNVQIYHVYLGNERLGTNRCTEVSYRTAGGNILSTNLLPGAAVNMQPNIAKTARERMPFALACLAPAARTVVESASFRYGSVRMRSVVPAAAAVGFQVRIFCVFYAQISTLSVAESLRWP